MIYSANPLKDVCSTTRSGDLWLLVCHLSVIINTVASNSRHSRALQLGLTLQLCHHNNYDALITALKTKDTQSILYLPDWGALVNLMAQQRLRGIIHCQTLPSASLTTNTAPQAGEGLQRAIIFLIGKLLQLHDPTARAGYQTLLDHLSVPRPMCTGLKGWVTRQKY